MASDAPVTADDAPRLKSPTIDAEEVAKFSAMAADWWNPTGKFRPLHVLNPVRIRFIRDAACAAFGLDATARAPLDGLRLLDVGCGGGLIAEPMARLGAQVTGVDAAEANVKTASVHAAEVGLAIDYRAGTAEALIEAGEPPFDIVLALEIVEHVADVDVFLKTCARLLAPGGLLVLSTLNRTPKAFALAIVGAEHVLRWLPRGTHDWSKFVTPEEMRAPLAAEGLTVAPAVGVSYTPIADRWRLSRDVSVNYMMTARR